MIGASSAAIGAGAALLGWSWITVQRSTTVPAWEGRTFDAINGVADGLWPLVWVPMQGGSFLGSIVVSGALARSVSGRVGVATLAATQAAFWGAKAVKRRVRRARPVVMLVNVHQRERATGLGFVSGHAAVSFAAATVAASAITPVARPAVFGLALVVATARVYAGAHLPLDVLGGAGLGLLTGGLSTQVLAQM